MHCPVGANGTTECVIHGIFWSPHCLGVSGFIEFGSAPSNGATDHEEKQCDEAVWYRDDKVADAWNVIVSCGVEVDGISDTHIYRRSGGPTSGCLRWSLDEWVSEMVACYDSSK